MNLLRTPIALAALALPTLALAGTDTQVSGIDATDQVTLSAEVTSSITLSVSGDGNDTLLTDNNSSLDFGQVDAYGTQTVAGASGSNVLNDSYGGAFVIGSLEVQVEFQGYSSADITLERSALSGTGGSAPDIVYNLGASGAYDWSTNQGAPIPETPLNPITVGSGLASGSTIDLQVGFGLVEGTEAGTYTTDLLFTAIGN